jgi:hypothetical protein
MRWPNARTSSGSAGDRFQWDELRHTLAENDHRRHPELLKFIERPERAEQEYWWYDPAEWSLQAEAA